METLIKENDGVNDLESSIVQQAMNIVEKNKKMLANLKDIDFKDYHLKDKFFDYINYFNL